MLLVDEAGTSHIDSIAAALGRIAPTLEKAAFLGDNQQIPPYIKQGLRSLHRLRHAQDFMTTLGGTGVPII
jgi:hypothetical protein